MQQSPSTETNSSSATQEIPHVLRNPQVYHRIHNSPPPVPVLSQTHPVHLTSRRSIFNIILPSTPGYFKWYPVSTPKPCMHLSSPHTCYTACPSFFFKRSLTKKNCQNSHDRKMEMATQCRRRSSKTTRFSSALLCT